MTCEVKEAIFEIFSHSSCINAMNDLFRCNHSPIKLDEETLRLLMRKCGNDLTIEPEKVDDVCGYANACIALGRQNEAKKLILRIILDESCSEEGIEELKEKYRKRFTNENIWRESGHVLNS